VLQSVKDNGTVRSDVSNVMYSAVGGEVSGMCSVDEVVYVALHCAKIRHHFDLGAAPVERAILFDPIRQSLRHFCIKCWWDELQLGFRFPDFALRVDPFHFKSPSFAA
jgi:hypothetical protein